MHRISVVFAFMVVGACQPQSGRDIAVEADVQALQLASAGGSKSDALPIATTAPGTATASTYYCCSAGEDPIHNSCRQMLGPHGICLRVTWKCTSTGVSTGCTSQSASQTITSGD